MPPHSFVIVGSCDNCLNEADCQGTMAHFEPSIGKLQFLHLIHLILQLFLEFFRHGHKFQLAIDVYHSCHVEWITTPKQLISPLEVPTMRCILTGHRPPEWKPRINPTVPPLRPTPTPSLLLLKHRNNSKASDSSSYHNDVTNRIVCCTNNPPAPVSSS